MADRRPRQSQVGAANKVAREQETDRAIAEARLTVPTMTPEERARSAARRMPAGKPRARDPRTPRQG